MEMCVSKDINVMDRIKIFNRVHKDCSTSDVKNPDSEKPLNLAKIVEKQKPKIEIDQTDTTDTTQKRTISFDLSKLDYLDRMETNKSTLAKRSKVVSLAPFQSTKSSNRAKSNMKMISSPNEEDTMS